MFSGVHDSEIVAYGYDSRKAELTLSCAPGTGSAQGDFAIVFSGVAAHRFQYPLLPAIVGELSELPISDLLRSETDNLRQGSRECGWPGPWFTSLENAISYCATNGLRAFHVSQSYGMSGWVIARAVTRRDGT